MERSPHLRHVGIGVQSRQKERESEADEVQEKKCCREEVVSCQLSVVGALRDDEQKRKVFQNNHRAATDN